MPRFNIKDLLIATALVALGSFLITGPFDPTWGLKHRVIGEIFAASVFGGYALIGCGLGYPFSKAKIGAIVGLAGGIAIALLLALYAMFGR